MNSRPLALSLLAVAAGLVLVTSPLTVRDPLFTLPMITGAWAAAMWAVLGTAPRSRGLWLVAIGGSAAVALVAVTLGVAAWDRYI